MKRLSLLLGLLVLVTSPVMAHPGHGLGGLSDGVMHPLMGLDHLLAMLTVGIWSALALQAKSWLGPVTFMGAMLVGALLGTQQIALPMLEPSIALSVVVMGLILMSAAKLPVPIALSLIAGFALFHGNAHGLEAPSSGSMVTYMLGFLMSTAGLHIAGLGIGKWAERYMQTRLIPVLGSVVSMLGMWLLLGN